MPPGSKARDHVMRSACQAHRQNGVLLDGLGDQFGRRGSRDRSRTVRAGAGSLVTAPSDQPAIGSDLDLDLFRILGVAGHKRRAALRATPLLLRPLAEILDDRQVTVVPPSRTGSILPLTPLGRR